SKTITVLVNGDTLLEPTETFYVNLYNPVGATVTDWLGVGTITNDDVGIAVSDVTLTEGTGGPTAANFTVSLSPSSSSTVSSNWATADGTALAASDYTAASGTVTFAPGETSKTITVLVNADAMWEGTETFYVNLSGPVNGTISDAQGVGWINN